MITKEKMLDHFKTVEQVAQFFGISVQAVYQWPDKIPRERELELMLRLPEVFNARDPLSHSRREPNPQPEEAA